jgi:hypothetical protein
MQTSGSKHVSLPHRFLAVIMFTALAHGGEPNRSDRLLIEEVHVLEPGETGFEVRGPLDVVIDGGVVTQVDPVNEVRLKPGEMKLRGQGRWLIPAPRARLAGMPSSSDLVLAGSSGIGGVLISASPGDIELLQARSSLGAPAIPALLGSDAHVDCDRPLKAGRAPTLKRVVDANGGSAAVVRALSTHPRGSFHPGARASFLLLDEDPRKQPDSLCAPHAVILGSKVILLPERETRVEEGLAHERLEPLPNPLDGRSRVEGEQIWSRRYRLTIDGLVRGEARLAVIELESGEIEARLNAQTAAPLAERTVARCELTSGAGVLELRCQDLLVEAEAARPDGEQDGLALMVKMNGEPVGSSPLSLESEDRFLPHTLLALLDASLAGDDPPGGSSVEIELFNDQPGVYSSPRRALRAIRPSDQPPLVRSMLLRLGGAEAATVRVFPGDEAAEIPAGYLVLDQSKRPLLFLLYTPWGIVEWAGGGLNGPISSG